MRNYTGIGSCGFSILTTGQRRMQKQNAEQIANPLTGETHMGWQDWPPNEATLAKQVALHGRQKKSASWWSWFWSWIKLLSANR